MKSAALSMALLVSGPALAQYNPTTNTFGRGTYPTSDNLNTALAAAQARAIAASAAAIAAKQDINGDASGQHVTPAGGAAAQLSDLLSGAAPLPNLSIMGTPGAVNTSFAAGGLTNGVMVSGGGNRISYCPVLACVTSPTTDHQRTSALFWSTTADDGHSEEQTVAIETIIGTGYAKPWTVSTAYAVGDNVKMQDARNAVYRVTTAGTSASTGTGPTGTGSAITDGTVVWQWVNAAAIDGKVGLYNEVSVIPGGGASWAQANNVTMQPGVIPSFNINTEMDFTNNAADCGIGVANCNGLEINMAGSHRSTTGIHLGSTNAGTGYAALWGIRLNGQYLASMADIEIDSAAPIGLGFNASGFGSTGHSTAAIVDSSTGLNSYFISGTHTGADINDTTSSPAAFGNSGTHSLGTFLDTSSSPYVFNVSGTHSAATLQDASTAPAALNLQGTNSLAAIATLNATTGTALLAAPGQKVCWGTTASSYCAVGDPADKFFVSRGGVNKMSVDASGNMRLQGTLSQSVTP